MLRMLELVDHRDRMVLHRPSASTSSMSPPVRNLPVRWLGKISAAGRQAASAEMG